VYCWPATVNSKKETTSMTKTGKFTNGRLPVTACRWVAAAVMMLTVRAASAEETPPEKHEPLFPRMDSRHSPEETFDLNTFSIIREGASWRVNRGKYRESTTRNEFLTTIGRQDLLPTVDPTRRTAGLATLWTGIVMASVGGGLLAYELEHSDVPNFTGTTVDKAAWGLIGVGTVAIIAGALLSKRRGPRISSEDAERMADDYNNQLKAFMRRQIDEAPVQARGPAAVPAGPRVVGLVAALRF